MKRIVSMLLAICMVLSMSCIVIAADGLTADTTWYNADAKDLYISDAADLLGWATLASEGKTFAGQTIHLTADIDYNPGWTATVTTEGDVVTVAEAPANVFPGIKEFAGTFDGEGYALRGIYMKNEAVSGHYGFISQTKGQAAIQNLVFENSIVYAKTSADANNGISALVGGIYDQVGQTEGTYTLDVTNVYLDVDLVVERHSTTKKWMVGGIIGRIQHMRQPEVDATTGVVTDYSVDINSVVVAGGIYTVVKNDGALKKTAANGVLNVSMLAGGTKGEGATNTGTGAAQSEFGITTWMWN
ncbi:MAG: hypothetical protein E7666_03425, partial [Ruminococcaceae bacterium]|nr:hypothetical protein [Oscillospiraceae bacterium]